MKPREPEATGQHDMFRSRLDQILDMGHAKVVLADSIDWRFLSERLGEVYADGPGQPPLPTRLMAGLHILKYADNLSDEEVCARWVENPYYQYFCGEEFFRHDLPLDRSSMTRWRQRMGEERLNALLQESLAVAVKTGGVSVILCSGHSDEHERTILWLSTRKDWINCWRVAILRRYSAGTVWLMN